ncbi:MAG: transcription antitermination factor NusB [Clostridia bacterium]|nr:transcription antitermination factor NusB [Clostridia bacterium]
MTRSIIREHIFKILFRAEFYNKEELTQQAEYYVSELSNAKDKEIEYIKDKTLAIIDKLPEIDEIINENSDGWPTNRLGKAELTIMRLAVYEIRFDEEIPDGVAINEAVELSKKYGSDNSSSFVNGVLAKIIK